MENTMQFCKIVRERSIENKKSVTLLFENRLYANCFPILPQELDSMVRVIFILSQKDGEYKKKLIDDCLSGERWRNINNRGVITDKCMIQYTTNLHGWAHSVYRFGCSFVHLSYLHDYLSIDPVKALTCEERSNIVGYMECYHMAHLELDFSMSDISHYLVDIFNKISSNIECYLKMLENNEPLD